MDHESHWNGNSGCDGEVSEVADRAANIDSPAISALRESTMNQLIASGAHDTNSFDGEEQSTVAENEDWWPKGLKIEELRLAVGNLLPGEECITAVPYASGAYHAIVLLTFGSGRSMIARVAGSSHPMYALGAPHFPPYKEHSEMATINFLRQHTSIPVPEIYTHYDDKAGIVGGEFNLQELLKGHDLLDVWDTLNEHCRISVIEQIADIQLQLFHLHFDAIGSLHELKSSEAGTSYLVGPIVDMKYATMDDLVGPPPEHGPWSNTREWLAAIVRGDCFFKHETPGSFRANSEWVSLVTDALCRNEDAIPKDGDLALCGLRHWDFAFNNILVDVAPDGTSARVTGVLDWEGAQAVPRWALAGDFHLRNPLQQDLSSYVEYCMTLLMKDPLFSRAHHEGRRARALYQLCLWFPNGPEEIAEFESGEWDNGVLAFR